MRELISVVTSSGPSEFSRADYDFMIVPSESSSESSKFLAMIQQVISSVSSFTGYLEFVPESGIALLAGLNMCLGISQIYHFSIFKCLLHCI